MRVTRRDWRVRPRRRGAGWTRPTRRCRPRSTGVVGQIPEGDGAWSEMADLADLTHGPGQG